MNSYLATSIFFLALALALASTPCKGHVPVSSFRLTQQWPAAFCYFHNKCNKRLLVTNNFTVHGLWPMDSAQRIMAPRTTSCVKPPYNGGYFMQSSIKHIEGDLQKIWPSFTEPKSMSFWKYEWNQHGACSEHILSQSDYFKKAIELKNKHNIFDTLQKNGIVPNDRPYPENTIRQAIINGIKLEPILYCKSNGTASFLVEITLCVDSKTGAFMDCTAASVGCYNKTITYKSVSSLRP